ncbi:haloacid dehalogenase superfamily, subfamily IA, variant 3 with third motif having DD or ED [Blastococcus fimeti]|nr:haloacid dehalogenase superfamily, subfamily IA, variant 3 with third motif having DD or ED [Blastococcus fimeti]
MTAIQPERLAGLRALLCDADDTLVPSEAPAFEASAEVTNRFLAAHGIDHRVTPEELRSRFTGKNFRTTARELAAASGVEAPDLDDWVDEEKRVVTAHLSAVLQPDAEVLDVLAAAGRRLTLAAVSSSALTRLDGSFRAAGLAALLPPERRFSAEDSLPTPTSKPDPAVYLHACRELGIEPAEGLAIEDSVSGATSAVRAGCPTVGTVVFVPEAERADRRRQLEEAGVLVVVESWRELGDLLPAASSPTVG